MLTPPAWRRKGALVCHQIWVTSTQPRERKQAARKIWCALQEQRDFTGVTRGKPKNNQSRRSFHTCKAKVSATVVCILLFIAHKNLLLAPGPSYVPFQQTYHPHSLHVHQSDLLSCSILDKQSCWTSGCLESLRRPALPFQKMSPCSFQSKNGGWKLAIKQHTSPPSSQ